MGRTSMSTSEIKYGQWRAIDVTRVGPGVFKTSNTSGTGKVSLLTEQRSSINCPDFHKKIKTGTPLSQQPFGYIKSTRFYPNRSLVEVTSSGPYAGTSYQYFGPTDSATSQAETNFSRVFTGAENLMHRNEAIIKLRSKIKGMSVNLAQVYAERQMAMDLIGDSIFKLAKAANDIKHGKMPKLGGKGLGGSVSKGPQGRFQPSSSGSWEQNFARNWLEFQYGWRPMLNDIDGACKALAELGNPRKILSAHARSKRVYHDAWTEGTLSKANKSLEVSRDWNFTAHVAVDAPAAHNLSTLGLTNPLTIAWELMPWSFVVDWVLPIGPWVEGFDAMVGLTAISTSETTFVNGRSYCEVTTVGKSTDTLRTTIDRSSYEEVQVSRQILSGVPVAFTPYLKNPLSPEHCANALGLMVQVFRGKK